MALQGLKQLYWGAENGRTYVYDSDTFSDKDGTAISVRVRTKEYYLSGPDVLDEIQRIYIYADEPQATNVSISLDGGDYEFLGTITETDEPQRFDIWKKCYHFSIGFDEISTNNIKIKGFNIIYEPQPEIR